MGVWYESIVENRVFLVVISALIITTASALSYPVWSLEEWSRRPIFTVQAACLSVHFKDSTLQTDAEPVITSNGGVGMGVMTTGEPEDSVTVWDCGIYGRLISHDEDVFRWAQSTSTLKLKEWNGEVRIVGIEKR